MKKAALLSVTVLLIAVAPGKAETYGGGSGTAEDPYLIYDANQMNAIGANPSDWDKHFKLMNDIDLSAYTGTAFNLIGCGDDTNCAPVFSGSFDGNVCKIFNFSYTCTGLDTIALFRRVRGADAVIKDLILVDPQVEAGSGNQVAALVGWLGPGWYSEGLVSGCRVQDGNVSGNEQVGGLVGRCDGVLRNSRYTGSVSGSSDVGGLVGFKFAPATIYQCYSTGSVTGSYQVGGLVGHNGGGLDANGVYNCYSLSNVSGGVRVGGLVGLNASYEAISKCYSAGPVSGSSEVGGLVAVNSGLVIDSFWDRQTSGWIISAGGTYWSTSKMRTESTYTVVGWDFNTPVWRICNGLCYPVLAWQEGPLIDVSPPELQFDGLLGGPNPGERSVQIRNCGIGTVHWDIAEDCNWVTVGTSSGTSSACVGQWVWVAVDITGLAVGDYYCELTVSDPCAWNSPQTIGVSLSVVEYAGGSGAPEDPFLIYTPEQMNSIGVNPSNWDKHFKLMADIDLSGYTGTAFNMIGTDGATPFTGVFDGNHQRISNFSYRSNRQYYTGLFGVVDGTEAEIRALTVIEPNVNGGSGHLVGSLIGDLRSGLVTDCHVQGGSVVAEGPIGGLVGFHEGGTISDCSASCDVVGGGYVGGLIGRKAAPLYNSYATGDVHGQGSVGGLVGYSDDLISGCYCSGSVSGSSGVGGLAGSNHSTGTIRDSHSSSNVSATYYYSGGLLGANWRGTVLNCYATGSLTCTLDAVACGGLAGDNEEGLISNCYSTGSVAGGRDVGGLLGRATSGTVENCYSTGRVSGHSDIGGLVGYRTSAIVRACFWDTQTSGMTSSHAGIAKTTAQMYLKSTYTSAGWDFATPVWIICDGTCYPRLWYEEEGPILGVWPLRLQFDCLEGGPSPPSKLLSIGNCGVGSIEWQLAEDCGWLVAGPNSGSFAAYETDNVNVSVDTTGWDAGHYYCELLISDVCDPNLAEIVPVALYIQGPLIDLSSSQLEFVALEGGANPNDVILTVTNSGGGILGWQIAEDCNWLAVEPNSGSLASYESNALTVTVDKTSMPKGDYYCELLIADICDANLSELVPVSLHIQGPLIDLSSSQLEFVALEGGANPNDVILTVTNGGGGILDWQIAEDCNWLAVEPNSGSLAAYQSNELTITVDKTSMPKGDYYFDLTVSDPCAENSPQIVGVHLEVVGPELYVWPNELEFLADLNEPNVFAQILEIRNDAGGTLNWQIDVPNDCHWLTVYPLSGQSRGEVNVVTITVDSNGLGLGFYECALTVSDANSTNSPQAIPVTLHVYIPGELHVPSEYATIQAAIDSANEHDTIIVQQGAYNENADLAGKNLTIRSTNPDDDAVVAATIIDGGGAGPTVTFAGAQGPTCILTGFTIIHGTNGVYCDSADPTISNCVVSDNLGVGLRCADSDPRISNCRIVNNAAHGISLSSFRANNSATVSNCRITGNQGRGMHCNKSRDWIANCVIAGNKAEGIWSYRSRLLTIRNCTVFANAEAGIYSDSATITMLNSIVWDNGSQVHSLAGNVTGTYSNVQGGFGGLGNIDADPCFALPGYWADAEDPNLHVEPNDPNAVWFDGDYHLRSQGWRWDPDANLWSFDDVTSRCIDAGNPGSVLAAEPLSVPLDADNGRGGNLRVNLGAYGGTAEASMGPYDWALLADLTNDGTVDFIDLAHEVENWLAGGSDLPGDLDRNERIDMADLALLGQDFSGQTTWHQY